MRSRALRKRPLFGEGERARRRKRPGVNPPREEMRFCKASPNIKRQKTNQKRVCVYARRKKKGCHASLGIIGAATPG